MTAEGRTIRTEAESALLEQFEAMRADLPGDAQARRAAMDLFARTGLPHRRVESWHYTDLRSAMRSAAPIRPARQSAAPLPRDAFTEGTRLVVLDGAFRPDLSDVDRLPAGIAVTSLATALAKGEPLAGDIALATGDPVVALNSALMQDGVVIDIAPGTQVAEPLVLVTALSGGEPQAAFTRSVVRVGAGASVTVVEDHLTLSPGAMQSNEALVFSVGEGARLSHMARVAHQGAQAIHSHSLLIAQAQESTVDSFVLVSEGGLVRRQIFATVTGEHAAINLSGLSLLNGQRHADVTLVVDHAVPHGTSREFYRYILDGESTGVYQGKVIVRPHAQKTDGGMKSNALVLSDGAVMNNKPELEIFADDVVCGHGATVGQLGEEQLFYLMARGLPRHEAEALLIEAFGAEAIERIENERLREALLDDLRAWLAQRGRA